MFIAKKAPIKFLPNDILAPEMVNENNGYFNKAFIQRADQQTCRWTNSYSIVPNASTTLTSATANLTALTTRAIPSTSFRAIGASPVVTIESVTVNAYYTATVPFTLNILGETITFPVRDASLALEPYLGGNFVTLLNVQSVGSGNAIITMNIPAGVSITKFDVTIGFSSDKYLSGDYTAPLSKPTLTFPHFTDASAADASTFSTMKTNLETAAASAVTGFPFRWVAAEFNNIAAGTNASLRYRAIPSFANPTVNSPVANNMRVIGVYVTGAVTGATLGDTIQFGLANNLGVYDAIFQSTYAGAAGAYTIPFNTGFKGTLAQSIQLLAATSTTPLDKYLQITVTGTATFVAGTVYLLVQ